MDKKAVFAALAAEVEQNELAFPTGARVALKLKQSLDDPDARIDVVVKLVQAEPLLAARVVAIANSVVYNRSGREVTDVRTAITRLGFSTVRSLAMALVTRQMAGQAGLKANAALVDRLWAHTAQVASLAHVIARRVTRLDPETAMFAAIVHEVGGFYLLSRAAEFPGLLEGGFTEWMEQGEARLGAAVLARLGVPEPVTRAVAQYWDGFMAMPPVTLGDTLLLAKELATLPSPLHDPGLEMPAAGSTASIEMVIGEALLTEIMQESEAEARSLADALSF